MAEERGGARRDGTGTAGGTDVEPLRGGMREVDAGQLGPEHERREVRGGEAAPPAPYHDVAVPDPGGLAAGATPTRQPPPVEDGADIERRAGGKVEVERRDLEREAANAPREDPGASGAGDPRSSS